MSAVFRIGAFAFEPDADAPAYQVDADFSGELRAAAQGRLSPKHVPAAVAAGLLPDHVTPGDEDYGRVTVEFATHGSLRADGQPEGTYAIEDDRYLPTHTYVRFAGLDYGWRFWGEVTLAPVGARFAGRFERYERDAVPVDISAPGTVAGLNFAGYRFSRLDEAAAFPPATVRRLQLEGVTAEVLPQGVRAFTRLREFTVLAPEKPYYEHADMPAAEQQFLPAWFGELAELRRLHVGGLPLGSLPESIGACRQLEQVSLVNTGLTDTPPGLWQLPRLEYLTLDRNRLTSLPDAVDLPALERLSVERNALVRLSPKLLAGLPKLNRLAIERNAFEALPQNLLDVPRLALELEVKAELLGERYRGADGRGVVEWDDEVFYARSNPALLAELRDIIAAEELGPIGPFLERSVKRAVGFHVVGERHRPDAAAAYRQRGQTRFGGMPDLPDSVEYPRIGIPAADWNDGASTPPYEFIAQLDCAALAPYQDYLPRTGFLYFFLSTLHDVYHERGEYPVGLVQHHDVPRDRLVDGREAFRFAREDYYEMTESTYDPVGVEVAPVLGAPCLYSLHSNAYLFARDFAAAGVAPSVLEDDDLAGVIDDTLFSRVEKLHHYVGGYGFSQHEFPVTRAAMAKGGHPADWQLLLCVGSYGGMQWGDAGELHFVVHKSDLAKGDFSGVVVGLYSG